MEPLGQSQVWRYLSGLSERHQIILISYEKADDWADESARERLRKVVSSKGVIWVPLKYHKEPSAAATAFDILWGILVAGYLTLKHRVKIVHARSYVPSVIALSLKRAFGLLFVFDMRGFWADERVDGGLWPKDSYLYRTAKWFERRFLLSADRVVSLTQAAVDEMRKFPYLQEHMPTFEVITTCADLDLFKPDVLGQRKQNDDRPVTLGYVGSVGVWYLFDETLKCFRLLRQAIPDARLHILNRGAHAYIIDRLNYYHIAPEAVRLEVADHAGVARAMRQMDAGIFFIKPVYSKMASAPTKLAEFLSCGIPCLANAGVGDMAHILESEQVGIVLRDFTEAAMRDAVASLLDLARQPDIRQRCRQVAQKFFSLESGIQRYMDIYHELLREDES